MKRVNGALIIIDMQRGIGDPDLGRRNNPAAEDNIAKLLGSWRDSRRPIVHVRHISRSPTSVFWPGQEGAEFQDRFQPRAEEHVVEKNVHDAYINTGLERWLRVRGIDEVIVVGVSTNNSVESTARSAGNLGFRTFVIADATYTFDKRDYNNQLRPAEDWHAMSLANLHDEYATVVSTDRLLGMQEDFASR